MKPNPKQTAIMAVVAALFVLATLYYPPLLPVCQALNFCDKPVTEPVADAAP